MQRVIQSGLDSIDDQDAQSIVILFKAMAVFSEDQVIAVAIVSVLWTSLKLQTGNLSAITLRQWLSELLSRSILIGSVGKKLHSCHNLALIYMSKQGRGSECTTLWFVQFVYHL